MDIFSGLATQFVARRSLITIPFVVLASLLGSAAVFAAADPDGRPLAQLGSWAHDIGWSGAANWLERTATGAFAQGAAVWTVLAVVVLTGAGLRIAWDDRFRSLSHSRVAASIWVAFAVLQQGGDRLWPDLVWWCLIVMAVAAIRWKLFGADGEIVALAPLVLIAGLVVGPLIVIGWFVLDDDEVGDKRRAS